MTLYKNWALRADAYYCTNKSAKLPNIVDGNENTYEVTTDAGLLMGIDLGALHPIGKIRIKAMTPYAYTTMPVFGGPECNNDPSNKLAEFGFWASPAWLEVNVSKTIRYVTLQQAYRHYIYEVEVDEILTTTYLSASLDRSIVAPNPPNAQFTVSGNVKDQYVNPMNGQLIDIKIYSDTMVVADTSTTADISGNFSSAVPTISWSPGSYVVKVVSDSLIQSLNLTVVYMSTVVFDSICTDTGLACPADVYLDNNLVGTTPLTLNNVQVGTRDYRISKTGYIDATGTVNVQQGVTSTITVNLNPAIGNVYLSTDPEEATIILDGNTLTQVTPVTLTGISAGIHNYILRKDNFLDYPNTTGGSVDVLANQTVQLLATLTPIQGCIYFSTNPAGADIYIDDDIIPRGRTPSVICGLSLGIHTYRLILDGYATVDGNIDLIAGQGTNISIDLTPCTPAWQCEQPLNCYEFDGCENRRYNSACCPTGDVCIKTNPAGASITIDGNPYVGKITTLSGTTCSAENIITGLSPGTNNHTYDISLAGYQTNTGIFSIIPGVLNEIDLGNLVPLCESATIVPSKTTAYIGEIISLTVNTIPTTQTFNIDIIDQSDNYVGNCSTSTPNGTCTIEWDTTDFISGEYNVRVTGQCSSPPITITLLEPCSSIILIPGMTTINIGDIVTLIVSVQPSTQPFNVEIRDQNNNLIGACTTSIPTGICTINWNTVSLVAGQYTLTANVINGDAGQCSSNPVIVILQPVVVQAGFGGAGMILIGGLVIGAIFMTRRKKIKD